MCVWAAGGGGRETRRAPAPQIQTPPRTARRSDIDGATDEDTAALKRHFTRDKKIHYTKKRKEESGGGGGGGGRRNAFITEERKYEHAAAAAFRSGRRGDPGLTSAAPPAALHLLDAKTPCKTQKRGPDRAAA